MKLQRTTPAPVKSENQSENQTEPTPEQLEQIRARAYELFELRGGEPGHDVEDWLQAEAEVIQPRAHDKAA